MSPMRGPTKPIGEVGTVQAGRQRAPYFTEGKVRPYLRVANVFDGHIDLTDISEMPFTDREFATYRLLPGDILLNEGQSLDLVGRSAIYRGEPAECCFQNTLIRFRTGSQITAEFAHLVFQHLQYSGVFARTALQTTSIAHLGVKRFASLHVPIPSTEIQNAVVSTVTALTNVLSGIERLAGLNKVFNRELSLRLLTGSLRSSQFGADMRCSSSESPLPTGWAEVEVGAICHEVSKRPKVGDKTVVLSCTKSKGLVDAWEYFGRRVHSADTSNYKVVRQGEFAYATNHLEEGSIGLLKHRPAGLVSPMYTVFKAAECVNVHFLYALLKTERYRRLFAKYTNTSVNRRGGIRWEQFSKLTVFLPPRSEQDWIVTVLNALDLEIERLERYARDLKEQRKTLISQLLSGRISIDMGACG